MQNSTPVTTDVYSMVTNKIIELLEASIIPWRKPWTKKGIPTNAISKRPYRGINIMLLNSYDFSHNRFLTWEQIKNVDGSVLKGEKGIFVVSTKLIEKDVEKNGKTEKEKTSFLRYYKVFNIEQCKDIPVEFLPQQNKELEPLIECVAIVEGMKDIPKIVHKKAEALYVPAGDYVNMPKMKTFKSSEDYYSLLFHQLIHATGHQSRLARKEVYENTQFGSEPYSLEALIAEIGSCYLKSYCGLSIPDMSTDAAYITNWLDVLKADNRIIITAAAKAQQAVEYILTPKSEEKPTPENEAPEIESENSISS